MLSMLDVAVADAGAGIDASDVEMRTAVILVRVVWFAIRSADRIPRYAFFLQPCDVFLEAELVIVQDLIRSGGDAPLPSYFDAAVPGRRLDGRRLGEIGEFVRGVGARIARTRRGGGGGAR